MKKIDSFEFPEEYNLVVIKEQLPNEPQVVAVKNSDYSRLVNATDNFRAKPHVYLKDEQLSIIPFTMFCNESIHTLKFNMDFKVNMVDLTNYTSRYSY